MASSSKSDMIICAKCKKEVPRLDRKANDKVRLGHTQRRAKATTKEQAAQEKAMEKMTKEKKWCATCTATAAAKAKKKG